MNDKTKQALELALEALTTNSDRVTEIGKQREAITAIREALEQPAQPPEWWPAVENILNEYGLQAIDFVSDFKAAMAEQTAQQQEPVSVTRMQRGQEILNWNRSQKEPPIMVTRELWVDDQLEQFYTSPQPSKPLTDEHILSLVPGLQDCLCDPWDYNNSGDYYASIPKDMIRLARAIEAAHGIKGDA